MIWAPLILLASRGADWLPALGSRFPAVEVLAADALDSPKRAPQRDFEFDYLVTGLAEVDSLSPRFRVFSQDAHTQHDLAPLVARMLLRLWQINYVEFGLDHSYRYNHHLIDVYLCQQGDPGGEQFFAYDPDAKTDSDVIFIYDLKSFTDPVEQAREIAHEYGHATLPPIGGYGNGEPWANGDAGEVLYMRSLRDALKSHLLTSDDAMGADEGGINAWIKQNADPLLIKAATHSPRALDSKTEDGRDAYLGWMLYVSALVPPQIWRRIVRLTPTTDAKDFPGTVLDAISESDEEIDLRVPSQLAERTIWVPLGNRILSGGDLVERQGGWGKVKLASNLALRLAVPRS